MNIVGIIPARYKSTRFPGKPLADICGKPMIQHVYERARKSVSLCDVLVATDDERIFAAVEAFGGKAVITDSDLPNGTARCEQALRLWGGKAEAVINVQGDEPLLDPRMIDEVAGLLEDDDCATLCRELPDDFANPNTVKVVIALDGHALYFSRSVIPYKRNASDLPIYQHIGIYGYRADFLRDYVSLPATPLSDAESLEQLKILEHGYKIRVKVTESLGASIGVDTPEDIEIVRKMIRNAEV